MENKIAQAILFLASLGGILDTVFLVDSHYNDPAVCNTPFLSSIFGIPVDCGQVTTSEYSVLFGLPISFYGLLYYITVFMVLYFEPRLETMVKRYETTYPTFLLLLTSTGFVVSTALLIIQVAILKLICLYCLISIVTSYTLFATSVVVFIKSR